VEVLSDAVPGCWCDTAERRARPRRGAPDGVPAGPASVRAVANRRPFQRYLNEDTLFARGTLTFAGVISRLDAGRLVLRTRRVSAPSYCATNTLLPGQRRDLDRRRSGVPLCRVFVRAAAISTTKFEGYQVVWGQILEPK